MHDISSSPFSSLFQSAIHLFAQQQCQLAQRTTQLSSQTQANAAQNMSVVSISVTCNDFLHLSFLLLISSVTMLLCVFFLVCRRDTCPPRPICKVGERCERTNDESECCGEYKCTRTYHTYSNINQFIKTCLLFCTSLPIQKQNISQFGYYRVRKVNKSQQRVYIIIKCSY